MTIYEYRAYFEVNTYRCYVVTRKCVIRETYQQWRFSYTWKQVVKESFINRLLVQISREIFGVVFLSNMSLFYENIFDKLILIPLMNTLPSWFSPRIVNINFLLLSQVWVSKVSGLSQESKSGSKKVPNGLTVETLKWKL